MLSRRTIVKAIPGMAATTGIVAPWIMTRSGLAGASAKANDTIGVGVIGLGIRGRRLMAQLLQRDDIRIVGVCDVAGPRLIRGMRDVQQHAGEPCAAYLEFRDLLSRPDIDAVIIATPDHQHAFESIHATAMGKHVYCEKPMTLTIPEGRAVAKAVSRAGTTFQTGSQQRSEYGHRFVTACEHVHNGRIGRLQRIEVGVAQPPASCDLPDQDTPAGYDWDRWLGQAPQRGFHSDLCPIGVHGHYPTWRAWREYGNGYLADMGAHHFDIAQWGMQADDSGPIRITPPTVAQDGTMPQDGLELEYADGVVVSHGGRSGCTFYGTDGWIWVDRGTVEASDEAILKDPRGAGQAELPRHAGHMANWVDCMRSGQTPICPAEVGHRTASVNQLAVLGYELGEPLSWDPTTERFVGESATHNPSLHRPVRDGWQVPGVSTATT